MAHKLCWRGLFNPCRSLRTGGPDEKREPEKQTRESSFSQIYLPPPSKRSKGRSAAQDTDEQVLGLCKQTRGAQRGMGKLTARRRGPSASTSSKLSTFDGFDAESRSRGIGGGVCAFMLVLDVVSRGSRVRVERSYPAHATRAFGRVGPQPSNHWRRDSHNSY